MFCIDVYSQYFEGHHVANDIERHAVVIQLQATSEEGVIRYEIGANFFPFTDREFMITWDDLITEVIYEAPGRRSKKREKAFLEELRPMIDKMLESHDAVVDWDKPLIEARYG